MVVPHLYDSSSEDKCTAHIVLFWVIYLTSSNEICDVAVLHTGGVYSCFPPQWGICTIRGRLSIFPVEWILFSVLLVMVPVFCVVSHCVRVRILCFNLRVRVLCCVSAIIFVCVSCVISQRVNILCYLASCPYSLLPHILSISSVTSHPVPNCFHLPIIFKCAVFSISIIVWNMSDAETEVFSMLLFEATKIAVPKPSLRWSFIVSYRLPWYV